MVEVMEALVQGVVFGCGTGCLIILLNLILMVFGE